MSYKYNIIIGTKEDKEKWNTFIRENKGSIFHNYDWLKIIEDTGNYRFLPIMIFKRDVLKAVFPVFSKSFFAIKTLTSPPPNFGIPELGPILVKTPNSPKKKLENIKIVEAIINYLNTSIKYDLINFNISHVIQDLRAYKWNNFMVSPLYTYYLKLDYDTEKLYNSFDGRIRTALRKATKDNKFKIEKTSDEAGYKKIIDMVRLRYKKQGLRYSLSQDYLEKVYNQFKDYLQTYIALKNGQIINGLVILEYNGIASHWIGGIRIRDGLQGLNESLHWHAITDYCKKGFAAYELMGANTKHLVDNKARYNPELVQYANVSKQTLKGKLGMRVYKLLIK